MAEQEPTKDDKVKRRKIRRTDWQKIEEFVKKELDSRKQSTYRKAKERKWKEIDRQIAMEAMLKLDPNGKELKGGWESAFELGELSKASEVITADVMRLTFPQSRTWMEAHVKPPTTFSPDGRPVLAVSSKKQKMADGVIRALMTQQHMDFGLKARVELSIKEAMHHGSFVATCEWEQQNKVHDGHSMETLSAPTWKPHSMWNCYPDSSPSVIPGGSIFYTGSMMIVSYMPRYKVLQLKGDGYVNIDPNKINKKNANKDVKEEDCELVTYYGDLNIEREDGDIYLPNSKCITANGTIIYYSPNPLPFPEVIYQGYERQDVRDPYFTSPIEKNSPMQKMVTILANEFIDSVKLHTKPAIVYDGNDPYMVQNGGVSLWPGGQTASKGSNKFQEVKVGDPKAALMGVQFGLQKIEEGTSVNAIRSGASESDRKTATEVTNTQQGSEVRTVDFVGKVEQGGLRPFLYMHHEMNLRRMESYSFYCPEKGLPDFLTITKKELKDSKVVHFEVVGSKGVLGEQKRSQQMTAVTAFALGNPITAPKINVEKVLIDMYEDAGVKGAEEYVVTGKPQIPMEVQAKMQQMQQALQECQQELQKAKAGEAVQLRKIELDKAKTASDIKNDAAVVFQKAHETLAELKLEKQAMDRKFALEAEAIRREAALDVEKARLKAENDKRETDAKIANMEKMADAKAKQKKKVKMKRTSDGYEVEEG
jgi:hypothetical protein